MSNNTANASIKPLASADSTVEPAPLLSTALQLIMAIACGVFVANIYYNQPLLELLQQAFPQDVSLINLAPTATQLGFACGLFLLVPLGDKINRRKLILWQSAALSIALVCLAIAPNVGMMIVASVAVGITGCVVQQIVPFAAELAKPERRGQVVGTVMSGVLCGILLGRAVGGFTGDHWGWRATFWMGAIASALVWLLLFFTLPHHQPRSKQSYLSLMKSLISLWSEEPLLRKATYIQATLFASFIGLWTILALRLHDAFHLGADVAGLMGIVGAVGILLAPLVGRIADRRGPYMVIGLGCLVMVLSFVVLGIWGSITGLIVGIILMDLGEQSALVSNQHVIYALRPEARSRLNTLFMTGMFIGGALGSWGTSEVWRLGGWPMASLLGGAFTLLGLSIHLLSLRKAR